MSQRHWKVNLQGEKHPRSKVSDQDMLDIKYFISIGTKLEVISLLYGIDESTLCLIKKGKRRNPDYHQPYRKKPYEKTGKPAGFAAHKPTGEKHPRALLTEEQVIEIKKKLKNGQKGVALAKEYNVSKETISTIKTGRNWSHVTLDEE